MVTITVEVGWYFPRVTLLKVHNCETKVLLVDVGIVRFGFWRGDVHWTLIETIKNIARNKQWLIDNAQPVRVAKRIAYAKGKAEGLAQIGQELKYWKDASHKNWTALQTAQIENSNLRCTISTLRDLDKNRGE